MFGIGGSNHAVYASCNRPCNLVTQSWMAQRFQTSRLKNNKILSLSKAGWRCPHSPRCTIEGSLANVPAVLRLPITVSREKRSDEVKGFSSKSILVVDDELSITSALDLILSESGFQVLTAHSFADASKILSDADVDLVITDFCLPDATGIDLIVHIKRATPDLEVILMTGHGSIDITIEA